MATQDPKVAQAIIILGIINSENDWQEFGLESDPITRDQSYTNRGQDEKNKQYNIARGFTFDNYVKQNGKEKAKVISGEDSFLGSAYNSFQRSVLAGPPSSQKNIVITSEDVSDFNHDDYKVVYSDSGRIWFVRKKDNVEVAGTVVCTTVGTGAANSPLLSQYTINLDTQVKGKTTYVGKTPTSDDRTSEEGEYKLFMFLIDGIVAGIKGVAPSSDLGGGGGGGGGGDYSAPPPPPPPKGPILLNVYDKLKFNDEDINEFISVNQAHTKLLLKELSKYQPPSTGSNKTEQQLPPSFLPFELSLDVDGISGMVLFQKFLVTNDVFPPQYEDNFDLIVTGVNHSVSSQGWNTNIKTRVTPSDPKNKEVFRPQVLDKNPNT